MTCGTNTITTGFVDLATLDEIDKYMYGGGASTTYFVRSTRKSTWFTQVPASHSRTSSGSPRFGGDWTITIPRSGDYVTYCWVEVRIPKVTLLDTNQFGANGKLRWTKNLMHNLVKCIEIASNDLVIQKLETPHFDFLSSFTVPASKRVGYNNMIGNKRGLIDGVGPGESLEETLCILPIPFFFSRDTGVALPVAALPFNEVKVTMNFRRWQELLVLENIEPVGTANDIKIPSVGSNADIATAPEMVSADFWTNSVLVSSEERNKMGRKARDILIEQTQISPRAVVTPAANPSPTIDLRYSHAIKGLFFAVRNTTHENCHSNYTTASPVAKPSVTEFFPDGSFDPISSVTLAYENSERLSKIGVHYFSLIQPYYHATTIPEETGMHLYSYSLNVHSLDPLGSTNYGKLSNVSLTIDVSDAAILAASGNGGAGATYPQTFELIATAINNNIIRISGGALGFPVM